MKKTERKLKQEVKENSTSRKIDYNNFPNIPESDYNFIVPYETIEEAAKTEGLPQNSSFEFKSTTDNKRRQLML